MPLFQIPATISKIATLSDSTIRIQADCQELPPEQMAQVFALKGKLGWLMLKENAFTAGDLPEENAPEFKDTKSPSQRLRDVLFVYWSTNTDKKMNFNAFWEMWIEKKIGEVKQTLPKI